MRCKVMGHPLIFLYLDPCDGDVYKCPCCGKVIYAWDLSKRGIKYGESFECDRCKILLMFK